MGQTDIRLAILPRRMVALAVVVLAFAGRARGQTPWATGCAGVPNSTVETVTWTPVLCQEFSGAQGPPATSAWSFDLGGGGWGNNELEIYCGPPGYPGNPSQCPTSFSTATANSYLDGSGHLVVQAINSGGHWYSARMKTQGVQNFQYGRLEASIRLPDTTTPGLWPAFWWLGSSCTTVPWPKCGETDIMENWSPSVLNGPGPAGNRSTIHTLLTGGNGITAAYSFPSGERADTAFHAYGVIWSANMVQFYVTPTTPPQSSIRPFFIVTTSDLPAGDTWPFNAAVFLVANVAVGGTLGGSIARTPSPDVMMVDYVRQYKRSAVPSPVLGQPSEITVTAGAMTNNTVTLAPSLAAGTGYVYFSCNTTAPEANCSIKTDDPLNQFVVNSNARATESVTVTITTTSNASMLPRFLNQKIWRWFFLISLLVMILAFVGLRHKGRIARSVPRVIVLGMVLTAIVISGCGGDGSRSGGGGGGGGGGASSVGTTPGNYTVTVYAFTETNTGGGANLNANASVVIPLTVN